MSKLSKKQIQDLMINMYPKRQIQEDTQISSQTTKINDISHKSQPNDSSKMMRQHVNIDPLNKISNKNIMLANLAISLFCKMEGRVATSID